MQPNTLSGVLNLLAAGDDSPLVTKPGPYTGEGEANQGLYKCYARRAKADSQATSSRGA